MVYDFFILNFSLLDSLKNAFSEHLEWLKFQIFSWTSVPKPSRVGGGVTGPSDPPAVSHTAYSSGKIRCPYIETIVPFSVYLIVPLFSKIGPDYCKVYKGSE